MRRDFREVIQGLCLMGVFVGFLFIDANVTIGSIVSLSSMIVFFLLEKGVV